MLDKQLVTDMFRQMLRIRRFEESLKRYYNYAGYYQHNTEEQERQQTAALLTSTLYDFTSSGMIGGAVHLSIGMEAVAVGVCLHLRDDDWVTSSHRSHGHFLAKGGRMAEALGELMGRANGACGGCGGSMHLFDRSHGFLGGNGIVGGGVPLALGPAFAGKYLGDDRVGVAFFGDGAANEGTVHEAMNLAALWKLPVLFVCENNLYAATTPASISHPVADIAPRAEGYGLPGVIVDGQDVLAVYEVAGEAVQRARRGEGPTFIEAKTYRYQSHCGAMAGHSNPEECALWQDRDPLELLSRRALAEGWLSESEQAAVEQGVLEELAAAEAAAVASPLPEPDVMQAFII
jgi:pyruvate dehydrogenase E1 component alpha subunit